MFGDAALLLKTINTHQLIQKKRVVCSVGPSRNLRIGKIVQIHWLLLIWQLAKELWTSFKLIMRSLKYSFKLIMRPLKYVVVFHSHILGSCQSLESSEGISKCYFPELMKRCLIFRLAETELFSWKKAKISFVKKDGKMIYDKFD